MKKSTFQILISLVIPIILSVIGGITLLWEAFSKYAHVFGKITSLILLILFFILPFAFDFYLSKKPIRWIFNNSTVGHLRHVGRITYIFCWFFSFVFSLYFFTYNKYRNISQLQEDATVNLIRSIKEKPIFLTGFFLPTNNFIDSTWFLTRKSDVYYQGQTFPEDFYTFVNQFYISKTSRKFFTSNVQDEIITISSIDTLEEKNKNYNLIEGKRIDSDNKMKDIGIDPNDYYLYFTDNYFKDLKILKESDNVNLPPPFRNILEKFEHFKAKNSFNFVSRKNKNFIIISSILDTFNTGDPEISIDKLPLITLEELQTFQSFSQNIVELYNESKLFIKARNISLDLNKISFDKYQN
jgi:hypothetical protein